MTTDWILIRRLGAELERELRGARAIDVGRLDDGRFAIRFGGRRERVLAVDPFGTPPIATLENEELALGGDPGYARAIGTALRGMRLGAVRARRGDRVLALDFEAVSRFGVGTRLQLVLELVPRFGNIVLLRDRLVVAAAKVFAPGENAARTVELGTPYEAPPLPAPRSDASNLADALGADRRAVTAALGAALPELPRILAESVAAQAERSTNASAAGTKDRSGDEAAGRGLRTSRAAADVLERATALLGEAETLAASAEAPLMAYRRDGSLIAAHLVPLAQFAGLEHERAPLLLPLLAEAAEGSRRSQGASTVERRRRSLALRIEKRLAAIRSEIETVDAKLADAAARDRLRRSGDALHTYGPLVPPAAESFTPPDEPDFAIALDAELDAKANAARYFARYRKATDALPHLERRRATLDAAMQSLEELGWALERADAAVLEEIAADLDAIDGRGGAARRPASKRRPIARFDRPSGARIYLGRSPRENAEITFRIARPDDLWFHARAVPGSHVVLQAAPGDDPDEADVQTAADLAARHSRARSSGRVVVDYTARKHVRKQRDAAPGLVWYVNAKSRTGNADDAPAP